MFVPLLLIGLAVLSAGVVAYGTSATWAQFAHGIDLILWSRRLEWPLIVLSLLLCLGLLGLVISGKRRAWWLIGLGPVLALFAHRFVTDPAQVYRVVEIPAFSTASDAAFVADDDYVVGLRFGDNAYAYPYSSLYFNPVIVQQDHEKRMVLMWSAFANRAVAEGITHDLKARDLEIVSMPANALLLYNRAYGQFINGLKGQTTAGQKPIGFGNPIVVSTMTWKDWREINPRTKVMTPLAQPVGAAAPHRPVLPAYPMPPAILDYPADTRIVLVGDTHPAALRIDQVTRQPLHVQVDGQTAFVFRESPDQPVRAFSCNLKSDLIPHFKLNGDAKRKGAMFVDSDTDSGWSAGGVWVDGPKEFKGSRLRPVPVQDGLYWGVMKFWYPGLELSAPHAQGQVVTSGF